jgi:hypothetical protein
MLSIYVRTTGFLRRSAALFCHDADRAARSRSPHHPRRSFSPEHLNPSPDATGINQKTTLRSHFRHMLERDWIPQVPSRAPQDNVTGIVAPLERIGGSDGQHSPYQRASTRFRNGTQRCNRLAPILARALSPRPDQRRKPRLLFHPRESR